ncbi:MAG TPA: YoaK family protein [Verrucomicrobiae bacterium]|nr:YoaK family protein [Verrucomicrobiae bacterium]
MASPRSYVLLTALTLVAGYTDAVAFFGLGVFTANMTGNTVLLAGALAERFVAHVPGGFSIGLTLLSLLCFALGASAAALLLRGERGRPPLRSLAVLSFVLLLAVGAALLFRREIAGEAAALCVGLLSTLAGMQSVLAARAGVPGITTIVVTGAMVTALMDFFGSTPQDDRRRVGVPYAADWALYFGGAVGGTLGLGLLGGAALWVPVVVVALLLPVL